MIQLNDMVRPRDDDDEVIGTVVDVWTHEGKQWAAARFTTPDGRSYVIGYPEEGWVVIEEPPEASLVTGWDPQRGPTYE